MVTLKVEHATDLYADWLEENGEAFLASWVRKAEVRNAVIFPEARRLSAEWGFAVFWEFDYMDGKVTFATDDGHYAEGRYNPDTGRWELKDMMGYTIEGTPLE
jgi:hypothetical protein